MLQGNIKKIGLLIIGLLLLGGLGMPIYQYYDAQQEAARTLTYTIPPGTAERLAAGEDVGFPEEIVLTLGEKDILVIENQDDTQHSLGPFVIPAQGSIRQTFQAPLDFQGACTVHPDQEMRILVKESGS